MISIPLPPSENERLMPSIHGRLINSPKYRRYKEDTIELLMLKTCKIPQIEPTLTLQAILVYDVYLPDCRRDASNVQKPLCDVLKGARMITNDKWLKPRLGHIYIDKKNPRVEFELKYDEVRHD